MRLLATVSSVTRTVVERLRAWEAEPDTARLPWVMLAVWAALLVPVVVGIHQRDLGPAWTVGGYLVTAAFAATFFHVVGQAVPYRLRGELPPSRLRTWGFGVLCVLATGVVVAAGETGVVMWFAMSQVSLVLMPRREAWSSIASIVVLVLVVPRALGLEWQVNLWFAVAILGSAWASDAIFRMRATNRALVRAQEENAALAVEQERLRFARDLHDIVGHSLTAAAVKAQLAGRLVGVDDDRVRSEIGEVEGLVREALGDVRTTVAGYREVTLTVELVRAATVLDAAGIHAELPTAVDVVPGDRRELFGWVVREAITNVVRHSAARHVRVVVGRDLLEVIDDGVGTDGDAHAAVGSGLAGLRERVEDRGGRMRAGPRDGGGWQVEVSMPGVGAPGAGTPGAGTPDATTQGPVSP